MEAKNIKTRKTEQKSRAAVLILSLRHVVWATGDLWGRDGHQRLSKLPDTEQMGGPAAAGLSSLAHHIPIICPGLYIVSDTRHQFQT